MGTAFPTAIEYRSKDDILDITFSDETRKEYPTAWLRGYCPCARCQGHGGGAPKYRPVKAAPQSRVDNVTPVGTYAICIVWGDGHDTGIYSFDVLRRMRPPSDFTPESLAELTPLELFDPEDDS